MDHKFVIEPEETPPNQADNAPGTSLNMVRVLISQVSAPFQGESGFDGASECKR